MEKEVRMHLGIMDDSAWLIETSRNEFIAVIHPRNTVSTHIYVGGKKKGCVILDIDHEDHIASLHVGYDKLCNVNGDLQNNRGTILMIKAACTFMFAKFPTIQSIILRDTSSISCENGEKLSLSRMQLFLYGKTWYQRYFDAKPDGAHAKLNTFLDVIKTKPVFSSIWDIISDTIPRKQRSKVKTSLSQVYDSSSSIQDWIKILRTDCQLLTPWLTTLFTTLSNNMPINEIEWIVEQDNTYTEIEYRQLEDTPYRKRIQQRADFMMGGYESRGSLNEYELKEDWRLHET